MLRLTLDNNEIDLYENESVNVTYQIQDVQDVARVKSSFSQTFRVPLTENNQSFFGSVDFSGFVPAEWNSKTKIPAILYKGSLPVIQGYAQVLSFVIQKEKYVDVEIAVFGQTADLAKALGEKYLKDLDLGAHTHALSYSNISSSWAGTSSAPFDGTVVYGIVDRGQNWSGTTTWQNPTLNLNEATPFIKVKEVLAAIMRDNDFRYTSTFFDTEDVYVMCHNGQKFTTTDTNTESEGISVGLASNTLLSANPSIQLLTLSDSGVFQDLGANWVTNTYTVPFDGFYQFTFSFSLNAYSGNNNLELVWLKNGSTAQTIWDDAPGTLGTNVGVFAMYSTYLDVNDTISIGYRVSGQGNTVTLTGNNSNDFSNTLLQLPQISSATGNVLIADNLPHIRQVDFLDGLSKMFNLVFVPDPNDPKKIEIEPWNTYMASGTKKDWTSKVDYSKDVQIKPTTDLQARLYDWTYSQANDVINKTVYEATKRVYGRYRIDDSGNDFANGTKKVESQFGGYVLSLIPGTGFVTHRAIVNTTDEEPVIEDPKVKLAYYNGTVTSNYWSLNSNLQTSFPTFSVFDRQPLGMTYNTSSLLFGQEQAFHPTNINPFRTLYYNYWRNYVNELYSSDSRILIANMQLTPVDIHQMEWSDRIFIKDTYYRVMKIENYNVNDTSNVKVTLLKIIDETRDCRWIPNGIDSKTGKIQFEDSDGGTDTQVSQECCERYGGFYDSSTSFCYNQQYRTI